MSGLRRFAWVLLALRVAVLDPLEILRAHSINDYGSFHFAAVALARGMDPYSPAAHQLALAENVSPHAYLYPPFLAWLLVPSSLLGVWPARLLWEAGSIAAVFAIVWLLGRWIDATGAAHAEASKTALTFVAAFFWPLTDSALMGQVNAFALLLLTLWWIQRDRSRRAGAWLGAAIAIKMSPALLLLWVLSRRAWREAATAAGTAGALVVLSCLAMGRRWDVFPSTVLAGFLPGHSYHALDVPILYLGNESLANLACVITGNPGGDDLHLGATATAVQLCFVGALLLVWGAASRRSSPERSLGALMIVMVLAPTYAWEHHLVFALFAAVVLVHDALGRGKAWFAWVVVAWMGAFHTALALPDGLPARLAAFGAMPKLVPLLAAFFLLVKDGLAQELRGT